LKSYESAYSRWYDRYSKADEKLAFADGRYKKVKVEKEVKIELTQEQIERISNELKTLIEGRE
jgi:hypothetical protein